MYVTRQPEEKYNDSYCAPKFRTYSSWTIHGSISTFGKGDIVFIEKEWGRVTDKVHRERMLPWVYQFMNRVAQYPRNRSRYAILMDRLAMVQSGPDRGLICKPLKKTGPYGPANWDRSPDR
jgi:hypothetical protein